VVARRVDREDGRRRAHPASGPSGACCATMARCAAVNAVSIASPEHSGESGTP
jgi:hypothetical protein